MIILTLYLIKYWLAFLVSPDMLPATDSLAWSDPMETSDENAQDYLLSSKTDDSFLFNNP